jgi:hypothetical protein
LVDAEYSTPPMTVPAVKSLVSGQGSWVLLDKSEPGEYNVEKLA